MTTKSINKLSTMLTEVLASTLQQNEIDSVMEAWNERKKEVTKLFDSGSRIKRKKDPNAPKKWKTGYILFCIEQREKLKKENSTRSATEITSLLGSLWKNLSEKDKSKYDALSQKDKIRYENDMESYTPPSKPEEPETTKKSKAVRTGPKRPLSSYMYFCQDTRESVKKQNPKMSGKEITSELGRQWKQLTDEQKHPFEDKARSDKERYESESGSTTESKTKSKATPKQPTPKQSTSKQPTSTSPSKEQHKQKNNASDSKKASKETKKEVVFKKTPGFDCFSKENLEDLETENPDWNSRKLTSHIQKMWLELSSDDREAYEMEATEAGDDTSEDSELEEEDD
jgi:upstream-binding transcription factor